MKIEVDGLQYRVIETIPFHQAGRKAKWVAVPEGPIAERVAVMDNGRWRWWIAKDRRQRGGPITGQSR